MTKPNKKTNHEKNGDYDNKCFSKARQLRMTELWWRLDTSWENIKKDYSMNKWSKGPTQS